MIYFDYQAYEPLFRQFGLTDQGVARVARGWREKHRHYHNEVHLQFLVSRAEEQYAQGSLAAPDRDVLLMAAFFHDVVYDPMASDNEEQSAHLFDQLAQHPQKELVKAIILDTKHHRPSGELSALFNAWDMAVVTDASFAELLGWERAIAREYQFADYGRYKAGRLAFLESCLQQYPQNGENLRSLIGYVRHHKPRVGIYPGSFNPFHNGHLNILEKAERVFDKVIVARGINPEKAEAAGQNPWPAVLQFRQHEEFAGLLTDYLATKEEHADVTLVRGLRNGDDLDYEVNQLRFMEEMKPDLKVVFIRCDKQFEHISSSAIRNLEKINKGLGDKYLPKF
jgi:pantetheine-phosphate adenylyltransferase